MKWEALVVQELEASRMTPALDDSAIEVANGGNGSDDDYVFVGESEEFRRLKRRKLELESQLNAVRASLYSAEETKPTAMKVPGALMPDSSVNKP